MGGKKADLLQRSHHNRGSDLFFLSLKFIQVILLTYQLIGKFNKDVLIPTFFCREVNAARAMKRNRASRPLGTSLPTGTESKEPVNFVDFLYHKSQHVTLNGRQWPPALGFCVKAKCSQRFCEATTMVRFMCHHVTRLSLCVCWRTVQLAFFLTQSHIPNAVSSVCVTFSFEQWLLVNFSGHTSLVNQKCGGSKVGIEE